MTDKEIDEARHSLVIKSNSMIRKFRFDLSVVEQKILLYAISQIQNDNNNSMEVDLSLGDFCQICGISSKDNLTGLKDVIKGLADKSKWITLNENGDITLIRWIDIVVIKKNENIIHIKLNDVLFPYLLDIKSNFTQYELIATLALKSKYSIRMYEILKSYAYKKICYIPLEEIKELLYIDSRYSKPYDFKRYVLDVAIDEINTYTDLEVSYTSRKRGRYIEGFYFEMEQIDTAYDTTEMFLKKLMPTRHKQEQEYKAYLKGQEKGKGEIDE